MILVIDPLIQISRSIIWSLLFPDVPVRWRRSRLGLAAQALLQKRLQCRGSVVTLHQIQRGRAFFQHGRLAAGAQGQRG